MDHTDHAVERVAEHRQTAVAMFGEDRDAIGKASAFLNCDDVAAWYHDVVDAVLTEMQQVAQHSALNGGQIAAIIRLIVVFTVLLMLGNCFFKLLAQGRLMVAAKEHRLKPLPYSSVIIVVGCGFRTAKTVTLRHNGSVLASFWSIYTSYGLLSPMDASAFTSSASIASASSSSIWSWPSKCSMP